MKRTNHALGEGRLWLLVVHFAVHKVTHRGSMWQARSGLLTIFFPAWKCSCIELVDMLR